MTSRDRPIHDHLEATLKRRLRRSGVVVWYDQEVSFESIVPQLDLGDVDVVSWSGSWYELRQRLEPTFAALTSTNLTGSSGLLVYVPLAPLPKSQDILLEVSRAGRAGAIFNDSLRVIVRKVLRDSIPTEKLEQILGMPNLTLEEVERLAVGGGEGPPTIQRVFGTSAPLDVAVTLLIEQGLQDRITAQQAFDDIRSFLRSRFGFDNPADELAGLRRAFMRYVLVSEFVNDLNVVPSELVSVPKATANGQVKLCRDLASRLRSSIHTQDFYARMAREIEQDDLKLRELGIEADHLGNEDTFPFEEETLLASLADLIQGGRLDEAHERIEARRRSFWTRVEPARAAQWQIAATALDLLSEADRVSSEVKAAPRKPGELARRYTGEKGSGWYQLDTLQRELERLVSALEDEFTLQTLLQRARSAYLHTAGMLADRFLEAIEQSGFAFPGMASQVDTFDKHVAPRLTGSNTRVAYFLVDALRFEMAAGLINTLPEGSRTVLTPAIAVVPTVTVLGMAALLPGAEAGIGIGFKGKNLVAEINDIPLPGIGERMRLLNERLSVRAKDVTLGTVLTTSKDRLNRELKDVQLCIVRSQEIDAIGEADFLLNARRHMSDVVGDVKKAMNTLAGLGFTEVVIAADHGHLLLAELTDDMKIAVPGGETLDLHRRCWIGHNPGLSDAWAQFKAEDLAMRGDVELAFPRGLAAFKAGGGGSYMHGGLSPQELIVPVLTISLAPVTTPTGHEGDKFGLVLGSKTITNQIFTVRATFNRGMFTPPEVRRRVQCVALVGNEVVSELLAADDGFISGSAEVELPSSQEVALTLRLRPPAGSASGTLKIVMLDAATGLELAQVKDIEYQLTFL